MHAKDETKEVIPPEGYLELPKPHYLHIQRLEKTISDLEQRVLFLEDVLAMVGTLNRAFVPTPTPDPSCPQPTPVPGFPSTAIPGAQPPGVIAFGFWHGPILHAPPSQLIQVCVWSSVMVTLVRRGFFGGVTPMVGATVTFGITAGTSVSISSTSGGPGVRPGASVNVTTNANGEATIYIHGAAPGTATLNANGPGLSKDTTINIV
jgi:hypothetical protein